MRTLRSYVEGSWWSADGDFTPIVDPCSEAAVARVSSRGIDFGRALAWARERGGPVLREMTFAERGALLSRMSKALGAHRDELIALSVAETGTTRKDAKFDVDGAIFTLAHYAQLGSETSGRGWLSEHEGVQLGRSARWWGQHLLLPLHGAAVQINAFNFPAWGFAEKAACALLAGVPVITKPGTSSAGVAERAFQAVIEEADVPPGALSLICGSTGDLLDRLGPQDVLAFTGSASTALKLRGKTNLLASSTRVNIEADSLNAAVLAPDVEPASETWAVFVRDVAREITQKAGQKCTAVRRVFVPAERTAEVREALIEVLSEIVTGHPEAESTSMGPLATSQQLADALAGLARLAGETERVFGSGARIDGAGNPAGVGYFLGPTLLSAGDPERTAVVHEHEIFGPVATLMAYDGSAAAAARWVGRAGGTLVTSVYTDDRAFADAYLRAGGAASGRLYLGSEKVAAQLPGSGMTLPAMLHGGPGRAGGGAELGGMIGLSLYLQRVALTGDRALVERLAREEETGT